MYSLSPIDAPGQYIRTASGVALKVESPPHPIADFNNEATFLFDPAITKLPATIEADFVCSNGGNYTGIPPFCQPNKCNEPRATSGIDFSDCMNKTTHEECEISCGPGYTLDADSELSKFVCDASGEFSGVAPRCNPSVCNMQAVGSALTTSACDGKRTDERCFVGCKEGYQATALLVGGKQPIPSNDLNSAPWAAGDTMGCMDCGQGEYAGFTCDHDDPVTSCRNWCAATDGCKFFFVHTSGQDSGRCCRVTDIPEFGPADADVRFYAMSGDFIVVSTPEVESKADLDRVCSSYNGMSVVSIQSEAKLERVATFLSGSAYASSNVPIGHDGHKEHKYKDLEDGLRSINSVLTSSNNDGTSTFFSENPTWSSSANPLIGIRDNALVTFGFADVHAVVCERAIECGTDGKFHGEFPMCVPQQCHLPEHSGTNFDDCVGKTTGESCVATCQQNHHQPDVVYDFAATISAPVQRHSQLEHLPNADLNIAFIAKITTTEFEWSRGALALLGGVESCCSAGGLYIYTTTSHDSGCVAGSNKFAFGVSSACGSDPVITTSCKYSKHVDYTVRVTASSERTTISIDGTTPVVALHTIPVKKNSSGKYFLSYLTSCHSQDKDFVPSAIQYPKVFGDIRSSVLTCGADREFTGELPCLQGQCPTPHTPLAVDFSDCEGALAGHHCSVSCREGNPSVDVAYHSTIKYTSPNLRLGHVAELPYGSPLTVEFTGKVSTAESTWASMDWVLFGGSETYCCGGSMYVFTTTANAGCVDGSNKYAIGFGVQCKETGSESPLITSCDFDKDTSYSVKVTYGEGQAAIFVNDEMKVQASKNFELIRSGSSGYALTMLNGCHDQAHEALTGSVSDLRVYSTVASHQLTCNGADNLFGGDLPQCLDQTCKVPVSSGVDYTDCISRQSGEHCVAKCKPGYSEDGVGSSDVRDDAVLWLEAADMQLSDAGLNVWQDHRGKSFSQNLDIEVVNLHYDTVQQAVRFKNDNTYVQISGMNVGPTHVPDATFEAWVKLSTFANRKGWFMGHDDSGYDRSLILHDDKFGTGPAIGVGHTYTSRSSRLGTGEWVHVCGTWSQGGDSYLYINGVQEHISSDTQNEEGHDFLRIGRHPSDANHYVDGWVSSVRIYHRALKKEEVMFLYNHGRSASTPTFAPPSETGRDVRGSALVWLQAGDVTETGWKDHRGTGIASMHPVLTHNVHLDHAEGGVHLNDTSYLSIDLDISPFVRPEVSLEVWVKLSSIANNHGWVIGQDNGDYDRTIMLHDTDFSGGACAIGVRTPYPSDCRTAAIGEWVHYVGVWSQSGQATLYRNGVAHSASLSVNNNGGTSSLFVGRHPTDTGYGIDGFVATVRVYGFALSPIEVEALYRLEETTYESIDALAVKHSASISLAGAQYSPTSWTDSRADANSHFTYVGTGLTSSSEGLKFVSSSRLVLEADELASDATTVEFWLRTESVSIPGSHLLKHGDRTTSLIELSASLRVHEWQHIAVVSGAGHRVAYVNGVPALDVLLVGAGNTTLTFGSGSESSGFVGHIAHIRTYSLDLSPAEVIALYNFEKSDHFVSAIDSSSAKVTNCDASVLSLQCFGGNTVHIKSARYGRFDDTSCLSMATSESRCDITTALNKLVSACESKESCSLDVIAATFGNDECPDVIKYLEVDYACTSSNTIRNQVMNDIRAHSRLWLEASDMSVSNANKVWGDHRGSAFNAAHAITVESCVFDEAEQALRFNSKNTNLRIDGLDVNPSGSPNLAIEMWVKSNKIVNNRGFVFGAQQTKDDLSRSIFLHDDRFGGSHTVLGVQGIYDSSTDAVKAKDGWVHIVANFEQGGESSLYKNGLKEIVNEDTQNVDALTHFFVGGHPAFESMFFDGWVSSFRLYQHILADQEVRDLYRAGRSPHAWNVFRADESARVYTCSPDGEFHGQQPVCQANTCLEPEPILGVDFSGCKSKATGESCSVACNQGYSGGLTTFAVQPAKECVSHSTTQTLVGSKTLQECKSECLAGLHSGTAQQVTCNSILYNPIDMRCELFQGCVFGSKTHNNGDSYSVTSTMSSSLTCGVFGRFTGSYPTCVAADKEHSEGGIEHVCEGGTLNLACPGHQLIKIREANFGRTSGNVCPSSRSSNTTCFSVTAMDVVSQRCEGKSSCAVSSSKDTFGNPCPGTDKYLEVDYECMDPVNFDSGHQPVCDNNDIVLECSGNKVLEVVSAFYGRNEFEPCPECGNSRTNLSCTAGDVLGRLRNRCSGHQSCEFEVKPDTFGGDPCVDTSKYLDIHYECHELPASHRVCESEQLDIDCGADKQIHVRSAFWGRSSFLPCPSDNRIRTNCTSPVAIDAAGVCEGQSSCSLPATSDFMGGDPCPETSKYLELDYECLPRPPSQRICDGNDGQLVCSAGKSIHLEKADYGRTDTLHCQTDGMDHTDTGCVSTGALNVLQKKCEGKEGCVFTVNNITFGDGNLCPATSKYLNVWYKCKGKAPPSLTCQGAHTKIDCTGTGRTINIESAFFGRNEFDWCAHIDRSDLRCSAENALQVAQSHCNGKPTCELDATSARFGDPCPGTFKYLSVTHTCV